MQSYRIRVIVSGRVQGVGFRFFVQRIAVSKHLTGFVKNQSDRTVLIEAQGPKSNLETLLEEIKKGYGLAKVENVYVSWLESNPDWIDFQIRF